MVEPLSPTRPVNKRSSRIVVTVASATHDATFHTCSFNSAALRSTETDRTVDITSQPRARPSAAIEMIRDCPESIGHFAMVAYALLAVKQGLAATERPKTV